MSKEEIRNIILTPDGTATFERRIRLNGKPDEPPRERIMETKQVDAAALIPDNGEMMVLPHNCRFMRSEEGRTVFVTEEMPVVRTVRWIDTGDTEGYQQMLARVLKSNLYRMYGVSKREMERKILEQTNFRLAFPYVITVYQFDNGQFANSWLYFRTKPLASERDGLLTACLPNLHHTEARMCTNDRVRSMGMDDMNFSQFVAKVTQEFWASPWNDHWMETYSRCAARLPEISSPWDWEYHTLVDSTFILGLDHVGYDYSIGETVRRLLNRRQKQEVDLFRTFETRVRAAEPYDAKPPQTDGTTKPSPCERIILTNDVVLALGCNLRFRRPTFKSVQTETDYKVEWLGREDTHGNRCVKLEGVEKPLNLVIERTLHRDVELAPPPPLPPVGLKDGRQLASGTILRFPPVDYDWGNQARRYYRVQEAKRNQRGVILAKYASTKDWQPVGDADELYPGLQLIEVPAEGERSLTLADGMVIAVGEYWAYCDNAGYVEGQVLEIVPVKDGETRRAVNLQNKGSLYVEDDFGKLGDWMVKVADTRIEQAVISDLTVKPGDCLKTRAGLLTVEMLATFGKDTHIFAKDPSKPRWNCVAMNGKFLDGVKLMIKPRIENGCLVLNQDVIKPGTAFWNDKTHRVVVAVGFRQPDANSAAILDTHDNQTLLFKDGEPVKEIMRVELAIQVAGAKSVYRGQRLRLKADCGDSKAGQRFAVSHIVRDRASEPLVVLGNGMGFRADPDNLALFEERRGTDWVTLAEKPAQPKPRKPKIAHPKEGDCCAVRYLGGDSATGFMDRGTEDIAKQTAAWIERWESATRAKVKFEKAFKGTHCGNCGDCRGQCAWIDKKYLAIVEEVTKVGEPELERVFLRRGSGARFALPLGTPVGTDADGKQICIGDRVRVCDVGDARGLPNDAINNLTAKGDKKFVDGAVFTVVYFGQNYNGTWMYLDAGEDVGSSDRRNDDLIGVGHVPAELRSDPTWWSRLIYFRTGHAVLVKKGS